MDDQTLIIDLIKIADRPGDIRIHAAQMLILLNRRDIKRDLERDKTLEAALFTKRAK